jgi:hypothetical protein
MLTYVNTEGISDAFSKGSTLFRDIEIGNVNGFLFISVHESLLEVSL